MTVDGGGGDDQAYQGPSREDSTRQLIGSLLQFVSSLQLIVVTSNSFTVACVCYHCVRLANELEF